MLTGDEHYDRLILRPPEHERIPGNPGGFREAFIRIVFSGEFMRGALEEAGCEPALFSPVGSAFLMEHASTDE